MQISYGTPESNVWDDFRDLVERYTKSGTSVADLGGGAHPLLRLEEIRERNLDYTIVDISADELRKAPEQLERVVMDVAGDLRDARRLETGEPAEVRSQFDVAFSMMVAEHIQRPERLHQNVIALLKPGGIALHVFPTLPTFPFLVNKLLPEWATVTLNRIISPSNRRERSKFPAYYRWCRGPIRSAIARYKQCGFEVIEYRGYFGHSYYARLPLLRQLHRIKSAYLERHPVPALTNYAIVVLRKPLTLP